jgi:hypothetical protein
MPAVDRPRGGLHRARCGAKVVLEPVAELVVADMGGFRVLDATGLSLGSDGVGAVQPV